MRFLVPSLFAAFLLTLSPQNAQADRADVRCVQAQLNASGFDAGPVDGLLGGMTRRALSAFGEAHDMSTDFPLHRESAPTYCRRIGETVPELRSFWPVSSAPTVEFEASASVRSSIASYLRSEFTNALREAERLTNTSLSSVSTLVVATTPRDLLRLFNAHADYPLNNARATMRRHCESRRDISGGSTPGIAALCPSGTFNLARSQDRNRLSYTAAFTAYVLVQYQLGGALPLGAREQEVARTTGPLWFLDGSADLFGSMIGYDLEAQTTLTAYLELYEDQDLPDLASLELGSARQHAYRDVYYAGSIAVALLYLRNGWEGIGQIHTSIADGLDFAEAFEAVYGQPLSEFYESYGQIARSRAGYGSNG